MRETCAREEQLETCAREEQLETCAREEQLETCQGTVIHHALRRSECTEDGCTSPEVVHAFVIDCEAIGCGCAQPMGSAVDRASSTGGTWACG